MLSSKFKNAVLLAAALFTFPACILAASQPFGPPSVKIAKDAGKGADFKPSGVPAEKVGHNWKVRWQVDKYAPGVKMADIKAGRAKPYATVVQRDNGLCNAGITGMLSLLAGTGTYNAFNAANSYIWVGNSSTAFAASQTALQGASKTSQIVDGGFPSVSAQTITWKSTYGTSAANHSWDEVGVSNGATIAGNVVLLNRKVTSFGTKASGSTWTMTLAITIS